MVTETLRSIPSVLSCSVILIIVTRLSDYQVDHFAPVFCSYWTLVVVCELRAVEDCIMKLPFVVESVLSFLFLALFLYCNSPLKKAWTI